MSEQDTREQLEADVRRWATDERYGDYYSDEDIARFVIRLLDRQAAITERELCVDCDWPLLAVQPDEEAYDRIAELTAERDQYKLNAKILANKAQQYRDERDELQKRNEQLGYSNKLASKSEARKIEYIDKLEAERDQLQKVVHIQAESFRKLEQELKEAKDAIRGSHDDDKPGDKKAEG